MASRKPYTSLVDHFSDHVPSSQDSRWDELWRDDIKPWDRGKPSLALLDAVNDHSELQPGTAGKRRQALVPGCGTGYDVHLLASFGYDVWGADVAATAIEKTKRWTQELEKSGYGEDLYAIKREDVGRGRVSFVAGDFFKDEWLQDVKSDSTEWEGFDLIYDYTFLCALPLELRPKWAQRMSQLLAPYGRLICLEFPINKEASSGGPPWKVSPPVYVQLLSRPGDDIEYDENKDAVEKPLEQTKDALVRVAHWKPERTHSTSFGPDFMSIWKHKF